MTTSDKSGIEVFIITGMHRSGTSMLAGLLHEAGISMGEDLVPGDPSNPGGHFEDVQFLQLHRDILAANRANVYLQEFTDWKFPDKLRSRAEQLIGQRRRSELPWGWKDPRTSLFASFWNDFLTDIPHRYLILAREPEEVVLSLLRRELLAGSPEGRRQVLGRIIFKRAFYKRLDRRAEYYMRAYTVYLTYLLKDIIEEEAPFRVIDFHDLVAKDGAIKVGQAIGLDLRPGNNLSTTSNTPLLETMPDLKGQFTNEANRQYDRLMKCIH